MNTVFRQAQLRNAILIILATCSLTWAQTEQYCVAFWNVENLFDLQDDPFRNDDDFTDSGRYAWTQERLDLKYDRLSQVMNDINGRRGADIMGLCEVENLPVLEPLLATYLDRPYAVVHKDSPDERGIDCALLYDKTRFVLVHAKFHPVLLPGDDHTRDILEAELSLGTQPNKRLFVFVNHWPSRWGGRVQTDPKRRMAAEVLRQRVDEILTKWPKADIVIMGDLNDHPDDASVHDVLLARAPESESLPGMLINTTWDIHLDPQTGTYMYRGDWGVLDQMIISQGMLDEKRFHWVEGSTTVFKPGYLRQKDGEYQGWPWRMYAGGNYLGGYSDHLPVYCLLTIF